MNFIFAVSVSQLLYLNSISNELFYDDALCILASFTVKIDFL